MLTKHNKISQNFQVSVFPKNHDKLVLFALFVFNCLKWNYGHQDDMTRFFSIHKKHHEDHETKQKFFNSTKTLWIFLPCKKNQIGAVIMFSKNQKKQAKIEIIIKQQRKDPFYPHRTVDLMILKKKIIFLPALLSFFTLFLRFLYLSLAHANWLTIFSFISFCFLFRFKYTGQHPTCFLLLLFLKKNSTNSIEQNKKQKKPMAAIISSLLSNNSKKIGPPCLFVCSFVTLIFSSIQKI